MELYYEFAQLPFFILKDLPSLILKSEKNAK